MEQLAKKFPPAIENGLKWPLAQLFIARRHKIIYCPVAKSACTTFKRLMVNISNIDGKELILSGDVHSATRKYRTGVRLVDLELEEAMEAIASDEYFRFTVIREPYDRLVSGYIEKFLVNRMVPRNGFHTGPVLRAIQGMPEVDHERGVSFRSFVEFILCRPANSLDTHWRPQHLYLQGVNYDAVYRLDQMDRVLADLQLRVKGLKRINHSNRTESGTGVRVAEAVDMLPDELEPCGQIDKRSFLDEGLLWRVHNYYREDYALYQRCD